MGSHELQRVIQGLTFSRLSLLLGLVLLAGSFYLLSNNHSGYWLFLVSPAVMLWLWAQICCLASPIARGWVIGALLCTLAGIGSALALMSDGEWAPAIFWSGLGACVCTVIFGIRVTAAIGRSDVSRSGCLLIVVPLGLVVLTFVSAIFGLGLLAVIILWLAFYSSYLGQVARALEEP